MTVVVDANIAVKWVTHEHDSPEAVLLYRAWTSQSEFLIAPPIFRSEVTNVLHRKVRRGELDFANAVNAVESLFAAVSIQEPPSLYTDALTIARAIGAAAAYDPLYLALAEVERCDMWTADRRFVRAVGYDSPRVRWIGELSTEW